VIHLTLGSISLNDTERRLLDFPLTTAQLQIAILLPDRRGGGHAEQSCGLHPCAIPRLPPWQLHAALCRWPCSPCSAAASQARPARERLLGGRTEAPQFQPDSEGLGQVGPIAQNALMALLLSKIGNIVKPVSIGLPRQSQRFGRFCPPCAANRHASRERSPPFLS
jgi:hypothetical protein